MSTEEQYTDCFSGSVYSAEIIFGLKKVPQSSDGGTFGLLKSLYGFFRFAEALLDEQVVDPVLGVEQFAHGGVVIERVDDIGNVF